MTPKDFYEYEADLLADITAFLRKEMKAGHCYFERRQAVGFSYRKGIPDLWFAKHGKHYEIELKKTKGSRSTLQYHYEQTFKKIGCEYACINSWQQFLDFYYKDDEKEAHQSEPLQ